MSKQEWTKESDWFLGSEGCLTGPESITIRKDPLVSSVAYFGTKANARRAYDCVMACKGIDSPAEYISSLRQENERLREALKPFADACDPRECKEEGNRDDWDAWEQPEAMNVKIGDFKRARQALTKEG